MAELFPVVCGVLVALTCTPINPRIRRYVATGILSVAAGITATILSGEFRATWGYVAIDIPMVLLSGAATSALARRGFISLGWIRDSSTPAT